MPGVRSSYPTSLAATIEFQTFVSRVDDRRRLFDHHISERVENLLVLLGVVHGSECVSRHRASRPVRQSLPIWPQSGTVNRRLAAGSG
jgi:hypothetical protein